MMSTVTAADAAAPRCRPAGCAVCPRVLVSGGGVTSLDPMCLLVVLLLWWRRSGRERQLYDLSSFCGRHRPSSWSAVQSFEQQ